MNKIPATPYSLPLTRFKESLTCVKNFTLACGPFNENMNVSVKQAMLDDVRITKIK